MDKELKDELNTYISSNIPWINEKIYEGDGKIRIRFEDLKKELGPKFEHINNRELYFAIKLLLYDEGIVINRGKIKNEEGVALILRISTPRDTPPIDYSIDEEIVPGIDYIREMEDFNNFKSNVVAYIIEGHKDAIKAVDTTEEQDGVFIDLNLEGNKDCQKLIESIMEMVSNFKANEVDYYKDTNTILFAWD